MERHFFFSILFEMVYDHRHTLYMILFNDQRPPDMPIHV
jgi:hypothetical protein